MGELGDHLDKTVVIAASPDQRITARIADRGRDVRVSFKPGAYDWYGENALAHQLGQLGKLGFTALRRDTREAVHWFEPDAIDDARSSIPTGVGTSGGWRPSRQRPSPRTAG
jgi:hypothetical protein